MKFHPDFDNILRRILLTDPNGRLVLANAAYKDWPQLLLQRFRRSMPDVVDRVDILDVMPYHKFLQLVSCSEVMLDTLYFGGGRTTIEAMCLGTPVVTMPTEHMRGRITAGLYSKMGLADCVSSDRSEYVDLAVRIASDPQYRHDLGREIAKRAEDLTNDRSAALDLESWLLRTIESRRDSNQGGTADAAIAAHC